jgi:indole-3-glycerol phosphate synthase
VIQTVPDILARIVEQKRLELSRRRHARGEWEKRAASRVEERRDFRAALVARSPAIISEIKKASPSKGLLSADFQPARTAAAYERGGAAALSVLTDESFFQGSLADLEAARGAVSLPALRKDFTIASENVIEAAAHGADAILLIVAILSDSELRSLRELAESYRMTALVEVHDEEELRRAAASGATVIGVNNRDLRTFAVSIETSLRMAEQMPKGAIAVSESGIHSRADIDRLRKAGYHACLIGEHLMKSGDPESALRALLS